MSHAKPKTSAASANRFEFEPIGTLHTCFKDKFGIPRQGGLIPAATGILKLNPDDFLVQAIRELGSFSHLWVIFVFHRHDARGWKPSIRPPRLGGAKKVGVLASRSPHRPNPIGMSVLELDRIDLTAPGGAEIHLKGVDILDGTPVLDIKPYIPYCDSIPQARPGWADANITRVPVAYTAEASELVRFFSETQNLPELRSLITGVLELDPRPAFQKRQLGPDEPGADGTSHGFRLLDLDVKWQIHNGSFLVTGLEPYPIQ